MAIMLFVVNVISGGNARTVRATESENYPVYFLNSNHWNSTGAYIYGDKGELLGGWGSTTAEAADELGDDWQKVMVPDVPPFNIIFYNVDNDSERAELYIPDEDSIYITVTGQACKTVEEAEAVLDDTSTTVYFLNKDDNGVLYENVYGYAYANDNTVGENWPGQKANPEPDMGDDWYSVEIKRNASSAPFSIIFNNGEGNQLPDVEISNYKDNYVTGKGERYENPTKAEASVGIVNNTDVYFLNSKDWPTVNSYVYGNPGEALGGWPGKETVPAKELGEKWLKVTVPAKPAFNIIFFNTEKDSERAELQIPSERQIYVTGSNAVYGSAEEAELAEGLGDSSKMTTLYFYDYHDWDDIAGYFYAREGENPEDKTAPSYVVGKEWPGTDAEVYEVSESGHTWWTVNVPKNADESPFYGVFNNGVDQTENIFFASRELKYVTPGGQKFATKEEAEEAAENEVVEGGDYEEGANADLDSYEVTYSGAGANLPYVTYEAEEADTNAKILEKDTTYRNSIQTEASGRQAVELRNDNDYVEFTLSEAANSIVLRYSIPDSADGSGMNAPIHLYADGQLIDNVNLSSKHSWIYGSYPYTNNVSQQKAHRFFDEVRIKLSETYPAGTKLKFSKEAGDDAEFYVIDFIDAELVGDKKEQPQGSISVEEFGAVADDGQDDYSAFVSAIEAAKKENKSVWIPEGNFDLVDKKALLVEGARIYGAGMWYTNLNGQGAAFKYGGTAKFYDFAINGASTVRDDKGDLAAFENSGSKATNVTLQNIWIEHTKVGLWSANTDGLVVQGCRIRNTYADGMNLCSKTNNSVVRNNSLRNTGDDCIAIWPWLSDCTNNEISHNTVQVPTLANGIAIYGGAGNIAADNHVMDTINNGAGIVVGTEFDTKKEFSGTTTVNGNLLERCGSKQTDENYDIGGIWLWSSKLPMNARFDITNNVIKDSVYEGILLECNSVLSEVFISDNTVDGATNAIEVFKPNGNYGHGQGKATVERLKAVNLQGARIVNNNDNFVIVDADGQGDDDQKDDDNNTQNPSENTPADASDNAPVVAEPVKNTEEKDKIVAVTGVSIEGKTIKIGKGGKTQLIYTISPANASNREVVFESSNTKVATVSDGGLVKAKKKGTSTITVTTKDGGFKASVKIKVTDPVKVKSVKLNRKKKTLKVGATYTLKATIKPKNATRTDVTWKSSDKKVAAVDENGMVTAKGKGTAEITVKTKDGKFTATCKIKVK